MKSFIAGVVVGAAGLAAVMGVVVVVSWSRGFNAEPPPALLRDMPTNVDQITPAFSNRVKAQFPVGSPEDKLIAELQREGFEPKWNYQGEQIAVFVRGKPVCRNEWRVFWRDDGKGAVTAINARFAAICL